MNFDEIKQAMAEQNNGDLVMPKSLIELKKSQLPIETIRKSMMSEIITQLIIAVLFFCMPLIHNMHAEALGLYIILMFVVNTMTVGYVLKMWGFHRKTNDLQYNSKETIQRFIYDLRVLMETYKSAVVAGSVLLPLPAIALILGNKKLPIENFQKFFTLDFEPGFLALLAASYIFISVIFYIITLKWAHFLYIKHIESLEDLIKEYNEETE